MKRGSPKMDITKKGIQTGSLGHLDQGLTLNLRVDQAGNPWFLLHS
jgi:hypothetical protein